MQVVATVHTYKNSRTYVYSEIFLFPLFHFDVTVLQRGRRTICDVR